MREKWRTVFSFCFFLLRSQKHQMKQTLKEIVTIISNAEKISFRIVLIG